MIVIDTSVWVDFFRQGQRVVKAVTADLLDRDLVLMTPFAVLEICAGARSSEQRRLQNLFEALPIVYPTPSTWSLAQNWVQVATAAGQRFGAIDLMIATLAKEHGADIWTLDADFRRMATLGFVTLFDPDT